MKGKFNSTITINENDEVVESLESSLKSLLSQVNDLNTVISNNNNNVIDLLSSNKCLESNMQLYIDVKDLHKVQNLIKTTSIALKSLTNLNSNLSNISFKFDYSINNSENKTFRLELSKPIINANHTNREALTSLTSMHFENRPNVNNYSNIIYDAFDTDIQKNPKYNKDNNKNNNLGNQKTIDKYCLSKYDSCVNNRNLSKNPSEIEMNSNFPIPPNNTIVYSKAFRNKNLSPFKDYLNHSMINPTSNLNSNYGNDTILEDNLNSSHLDKEYQFTYKNPTVEDIIFITENLVKLKTTTGKITYNAIKLSYYSVYNIFINEKYIKHISNLVNSKYIALFHDELNLSLDKLKKNKQFTNGFILNFKRAYALFIKTDLYSQMNYKYIIKNLSKLGKVLFYNIEDDKVIFYGELNSNSNFSKKKFKIIPTIEKSIIAIRLHSNAGYLHDYYDSSNSIIVDFEEKLSLVQKKYSLLIEEYVNEQDFSK